jgi:hypothetical protein
LLVVVLGTVAVWMGVSAQRVDLTLTNTGTIPHSVDFHAARIAPNVAFKDVPAGGSIH